MKRILAAALSVAAGVLVWRKVWEYMDDYDRMLEGMGG